MKKNLVLMVICLVTLAFANGFITGKITEAETGQPIVGATVTIVNTTIGSESYINGIYRIPNLKAGKYRLKAQMMGCKEKELSVEVKEGLKTTADFKLSEDDIMLNEITVESKAKNDNAFSNLVARQKSSTISDAISSEEISKAGSSDAASAMKQVTGATIVGGKYVYIRGLGERYSSTHLNGVELPSSDPDKKSFQMDMISSNILDNIVTIKTFTPDKPGNFSGGIVDIITKNHPSSMTFRFGGSTSYNNSSNFNKDFLTYSRSETDWLGFDNGKRKIPANVKNQDIPNYSECIVVNSSDKEAISNAYKLSSISKSFSPEMAPSNEMMPVNQSYSLSYGDSYYLFNRPVGLMLSGNYARNFSFYDQGKISKYRLTSSSAQSLSEEYSFFESKGEDNVNINGLLNLSYNYLPDHDISTNVIYSRSGISTARFISGNYYDGSLSKEDIYETRVLKYSQRELSSYQLAGSNKFKNLNELKFDWSAGFTNSVQDEPDMRFFSDNYNYNEEDGSYTYYILPSIYKEPSRYYRILNEDSYSVDFKAEYPFTNWTNQKSLLKTGMLYSQKERRSEESVYVIKNQKQGSYLGDGNDYFNPEKMGIVDSLKMGDYTKYIFGNYVVDASEDRADYEGEEEIGAIFLMTDMALLDDLKFIGGLRLETTDMLVATKDSTYEKGKISEVDYLPSINFIYNISDKFNIRASYGRTLARPNMRELAPFPSFDFVGGFFFTGNTKLERTLINNYDLRFELFERLGELYSVSGFYKDFYKPIEKVILNDNGEVQYQNVDKAIVAGIELEARKNLDFISSYLSNFSINANLSLIYSQVDIAESELKDSRNDDEESSGQTRELQGQSPYILNFGLNYQNDDTQTNASISYGTFGKRLSEVSMGATPNIYELPSHNLDLTVGQTLFEHLNIKLTAKNLIDLPVKKVYEFNGKEFVNNENSKGKSYSISLSYNIK